MPSSGVDKTKFLEIDIAIASWQQGDCVIGDYWFPYRICPDLPLTEDSIDAATQQLDVSESKVEGLVVVSQTCDLVRPCEDRAFVEIAPLVEVDGSTLHTIKRGYRPKYAFIPGVADKLLVADLDRIMTAEKAVLAKWTRIIGCNNDIDIRKFGEALGRKRSRFAFPDDFNHWVNKLSTRIEGKHDRQSEEGDALRALLEIRVQAEPDWNQDSINVFFWFIRNESDTTFNDSEWCSFQRKWLDLVPPGGRFKAVDGFVGFLEDLTAKDYTYSDRLDLDHLSIR